MRFFLILAFGLALLAAPPAPGADGGTAGRPAQTTGAASSSASYDPSVAGMMAQVSASTVYTYTGQLSGAWPAAVGGSLYLITTRHTGSGQPIAKAAQFVYEHFQHLGLAVSYQDWSHFGYTNRNVAAVITGTAKPGEIVLLTAHLDSICAESGCQGGSSGPAPGADDDASGTAGVMVAADILSQYRFERTLRFVLFTGEEQGMLGSWTYASAASGREENIVAVCNLDVIGWDSDDDGQIRLHTRRTTDAGYSADLAIAGVFSNVVHTYGLGGALASIITADSEPASDHASFWDEGFPAILAIEDDYDDYNPNTHRATDTLQRMNLDYFTAFVKAAVGTAAHLAGPRPRSIYLPMAITSQWPDR